MNWRKIMPEIITSKSDFLLPNGDGTFTKHYFSTSADQVNGLGTAALTNSSDYAPSNHNHSLLDFHAYLLQKQIKYYLEKSSASNSTDYDCKDF